MVRIVVPLLCILLWSAYANAQELPPRSYLFVEVANEKGERLSDATVRLAALDGKEEVNAKTDKEGTVKATFYRYRNLRYDLQVTKAGYLTYDSVLFSSVPFDQYFLIDRLTEEMPHILETTNYATGPPAGTAALRITLQPNPPAPPAKAETQKKLLIAVKRGDAQTLRTLLQHGGDANTTDAKGVPAVAWATFAGDPETIKILIDAGANVRHKASQALLIYLLEGVNRSLIDSNVIERLIQAGADVNASDKYRGTVLKHAITRFPYSLPLETIQSLIKAGADVNAPDQNGQTPLMLAEMLKQTELVKVLINAGAKR